MQHYQSESLRNFKDIYTVTPTDALSNIYLPEETEELSFWENVNKDFNKVWFLSKNIKYITRLRLYLFSVYRIVLSPPI